MYINVIFPDVFNIRSMTLQIDFQTWQNWDQTTVETVVWPTGYFYMELCLVQAVLYMLRTKVKCVTICPELLRRKPFSKAFWWSCPFLKVLEAWKICGPALRLPCIIYCYRLYLFHLKVILNTLTGYYILNIISG